MQIKTKLLLLVATYSGTKSCRSLRRRGLKSTCPRDYSSSSFFYWWVALLALSTPAPALLTATSAHPNREDDDDQPWTTVAVDTAYALLLWWKHFLLHFIFFFDAIVICLNCLKSLSLKIACVSGSIALMNVSFKIRSILLIRVTHRQASFWAQLGLATQSWLYFPIFEVFVSWS